MARQVAKNNLYSLVFPLILVGLITPPLSGSILTGLISVFDDSNGRNNKTISKIAYTISAASVIPFSASRSVNHPLGIMLSYSIMSMSLSSALTAELIMRYKQAFNLSHQVR